MPRAEDKKNLSEGGDILTALDERIRIVVEQVLAERTAAPADDQGLTAEEAARLLGVSKWRVYEMVRRGALPSYRPSPKTLRIPLSAVKNCIAEASSGDRFSAPRTNRKEDENP